MGSESDRRQQQTADLLLRHLPRILDFLYFRVNRHEADARDFCQETYVRAIRHDSIPEEAEAQYFWLCGIARNVLRESFRRDRRLHATLRDLDRPECDVPVDADDEMDPSLRASVVLTSLSPEHQEVLDLKYRDSLSVADIAARTGRTETAVQSLLSRARDAFRKQWERGLPESP